MIKNESERSHERGKGEAADGLTDPPDPRPEKDPGRS